MRRLLRRVTSFYGANPLHLLALLACFALAGYAALHAASHPMAVRMLIWFLGALIAHDLVLFPLYAVADRSLRMALRRSSRRRQDASRAVSPLNYLRTPALGSGLLFLLFLPGIIQQGAHSYLVATGLTQTPFLGRWLLVTGIMFGLSAIVYAIRLRVAHRR